ncbi:MAG: heme ABC transporter ATP-binding protein [Gammaproteobacteria bacterium]|nr:heme ABC transporter ATP-binding protein [Gammaproteobacteria bacterium]
MLKLTDVNIDFSGYLALQHCDLTLKRGEFVSLLGPNGAGKSTALKVLSGDINPSRGQVTLDNQPLHEISAIKLARSRAVMSQSYELMFDFEVEEVVAMAGYVHQESLSAKQLRDYAKQAMAMVDVLALRRKNITTLSGGQQQRVQLARVINQLLPTLDDPNQAKPFLLIDEPTSSLDLFHQYQVMKVAKALCQRGVGVLAVVHDLALAASFSDRCYLLQQGTIMAQGDCSEVLSQTRIEQVYGINACLSNADGVYPHLEIAR